MQAKRIENNKLQSIAAFLESHPVEAYIIFEIFNNISDPHVQAMLTKYCKTGLSQGTVHLLPWADMLEFLLGRQAGHRQALDNTRELEEMVKRIAGKAPSESLFGKLFGLS